MITIVRNFGEKIFKLPRLLIVPNRDGTVAHSGCTFCDRGLGDAIVAPEAPIREQFTMRSWLYAPQVARSSEISGLFSNFTNTHARLRLLRTAWTGNQWAWCCWNQYRYTPVRLFARWCDLAELTERMHVTVERLASDMKKRQIINQHLNMWRRSKALRERA